MIIDVKDGKGNTQGVTTVTAPFAPYSLLVGTSVTSAVIPENVAILTTSERTLTFVIDQFTIGFTTGMRARIAVPGSATDWMEGVVLGFDSITSELAILIDLASGFGSYDFWNIVQAAMPGRLGPVGFQGPRGPRGPHNPTTPAGPKGEQGPKGDQGTTIYGWFDSLLDLQLAFPNGPVGRSEGATVGDLGEAYIVGNNDLALWDRWSVEWRIICNIGGPPGPKGEIGTPEGPPGPAGPQGEQGEQGPEGDLGPRGRIGPLTQEEIRNALFTNNVDIERYVWRDGSRSYTGFGTVPSPDASANDTTFPNTNWVRGRINEGRGSRLPLTGGNVNSLSIGGTPVVRCATGNQVWASWSGGWVHLQVDNTYFGGLYHTGNFNPGNYWNTGNFNPGNKANWWDVGNLMGNKAWYWDTVYSMRLVHAGDKSGDAGDWHLNIMEPWNGGIITGGMTWYFLNRFIALRFRYLQLQYGDGRWVTVGYA